MMKLIKNNFFKSDQTITKAVMLLKLNFQDIHSSSQMLYTILMLNYIILISVSIMLYFFQEKEELNSQSLHVLLDKLINQLIKF